MGARVRVARALNHTLYWNMAPRKGARMRAPVQRESCVVMNLE
jgi:hypothetical protein